MRFLKTTIPVIITFIVGVLTVIIFFVPRGSAERLDGIIQGWGIIIIVFAMILGILNVFVTHLRKIYKKSSGWGYSVVLVIGLLTTIFLGFYPKFGGINIGSPANYIFINIISPLQATMFSLLAFFIASAAFRAFRAKTFEATLLLIAGIIVMLGRVPLGDLFIKYTVKFFNLMHLTFVSDFVSKISFPKIANWIMNNPNVAGQRAILIGAALGAVAISIKILLGRERTYLGGEE